MFWLNHILGKSGRQSDFQKVPLQDRIRQAESHPGGVVRVTKSEFRLIASKQGEGMGKIRIRLVARDYDAEIYNLSIAGAISQYRVRISGAMITAGGRWMELAAHCERYKAFMPVVY